MAQRLFYSALLGVTYHTVSKSRVQAGVKAAEHTRSGTVWTSPKGSHGHDPSGLFFQVPRLRSKKVRRHKNDFRLTATWLFLFVILCEGECRLSEHFRAVRAGTPAYSPKLLRCKVEDVRKLCS